VVGVGVALCVVRMTRERFLPLERTRVSRHRQGYTPTLRWVLYAQEDLHDRAGADPLHRLTVWLGIGATLQPVEWAINFSRARRHRPN
jgi:hypothetical protein